MNSMEIFFVDDIPMCIYSSTCSFPKKSWKKVDYEDTFYYEVPAHSYEEAIEHLQWRSYDLENSTHAREFHKMITYATAQIVDTERGDGFSLMLTDISEWANLLKDYEIPEIYK